MDLSIIIVNWNSKRFLPGCLRSIEQWAAGLDHEVIVIDSGSFDGCGELLCSQFKHVRFIQHPFNVGFAAANNIAFDQSRGRALLFLNPDTELLSPAAEVLLAALGTLPNAGALGGTLYNADGSVQTTSIQPFPTLLNQLLGSDFLRLRWPELSLWGMKPLFKSQDVPIPVEVISGACLMVHRDAFERVGRFSEDYFMYAEDLDLCHKLQCSGCVNYYVADAQVRHFGGGSSDGAASNFSVVMMRESIWRFLRKTRGAGYAAAYRGSIVLAALMRVVLIAALSPLRRFMRHAPPAHALRKWFAILAWSLRLKRVAIPV